MKIRKTALFIICLIVIFLSCSKDDNSNDFVVVEERDRAEQQVVDNDSLIGYFQTHYYNSGDFDSNPNPSLRDLVISELPEDGILPDPINNTLLIDDVETKSIVFADTNYEYYILRLNQGAGLESPEFTDNILVTYEGYTLDDDLNDISQTFDSAVNPVELDLTTTISGWRKVFPEFNTAESFILPGDGTVDYMNHGTGVMFLPSGLGYFSSSRPGIPVYSPLIFKFDLFVTNENDHDNDGVLSHNEDLNGDTEVLDDDTDGDTIPNYFDADDDNDGVPTRNEDIDGDGDPTNDIGMNGIPKYLDSEETESNDG